MIKESDVIICGHGSGNPSTKKLDTYSTNRYKKIAPNGVHKGIVCVRRLKKLDTNVEQKRFHDIYTEIIGRNLYSQPRREYVFSMYADKKYYSDCSSSGMKTLAKAGVYSGSTLNTAGIYNSNYFKDVPVVVEDGHIMNPEVLQIGDAILFAGDDPSRPQQIGHVEWVYSISGKTAVTPVRITIAQKGIHKGDKGTNVKYLQLDLNEIINAGLTVDGSAGSKTIDALKLWQAASGLTADGSYGGKSEEMMRQQLA